MTLYVLVCKASNTALHNFSAYFAQFSISSSLVIVMLGCCFSVLTSVFCDLQLRKLYCGLVFVCIWTCYAVWWAVSVSLG